MPNLNVVFLMGNLTRDPSGRATSGGTPVTEFGLAINRKYTVGADKREEVTFVDVTAFGPQGELIARHLRKGDPIFIEGRLKFDQWEKDGVKRSKLSVVLSRFEFLGARKDAEGSAGKHNEETPF